jgi:gamma-glutamylcyclotransferase (GGCT)/AIG2-like uncharacterized protein YtfP
VLAETITRDARFNMISMLRFPAVITGNERIYGELYEVDGQALRVLDRLEGNGSFYERQLVDLVDSDQPAWMYVLVDAPERTHSLGIAKIIDPDAPDETIALFWQGVDQDTLDQIEEANSARMAQFSELDQRDDTGTA